MWKTYVIVLTLIFAIWVLFECLFYIRNNQKESNLMKNEKNRKNFKINHHIPKFMLELYDQIQLNPNVTPPDIVRSITPINQGFNIFGKNNHFLLFKIPKTGVDEVFVKADLKILTIIEENISIIEEFHHLIIISFYDELKQDLIPIETKKIVHVNNTWLNFNITNQVKEIINENSVYLKLVISLKKNTKGELKLSLLPIDENNYEHDYPILLLTYTSKKEIDLNTIRIKRNIGEIFEKKYKSSCKKRSLYVNFSEIYYDTWIIQPRGYEAFQCQGKCFYPIAHHLTPTKHAVIQSLMHNLHPREVSKICCVPVKMGSISILYVENGILTYRYAYNDMVVLECGCR